MAVHSGSGIPRRALALNLGVIVVFLLPFSGCGSRSVSVMGDMYLLIYGSSAVAAATFRSAERNRLSGWIPGMRWIAPVSFVVASVVRVLVGWHSLRLALPLVLVGVPLFLALWRGPSRALVAELAKGAWVVGVPGGADPVVVAGQLRRRGMICRALRHDHRRRGVARHLLLGGAVRGRARLRHAVERKNSSFVRRSGLTRRYRVNGPSRTGAPNRFRSGAPARADSSEGAEAVRGNRDRSGRRSQRPHCRSSG